VAAERRSSSRRRSSSHSSHGNASANNKQVAFDQVMIREFQRRHGGSSTVPDEGFIPLGLDWRYEDTKSIALDLYEERRRLEGRASTRSIDVVPMSERWRKLERSDSRAPLELQASARRSAQEIEAIRRSRHFHNRGCNCAGSCRTGACPCFARGDECFHKICACRACDNKLTAAPADEDDDPPLSRRLSQATADLPVRAPSHRKDPETPPPAEKPSQLRRRATPARGMKPQERVFEEVSDDDEGTDGDSSASVVDAAAPAPAASVTTSSVRVRRRKAKKSGHHDDTSNTTKKTKTKSKSKKSKSERADEKREKSTVK
jgi:hypothetical protein